MRRLGSRIREELRDEPDRYFLRFRDQRMAHRLTVQKYELEAYPIQAEYVPRFLRHNIFRQDEKEPVRARRRRLQRGQVLRYGLRTERLNVKLKRSWAGFHFQEELHLHKRSGRKRGRLVFLEITCKNPPYAYHKNELFIAFSNM